MTKLHNKIIELQQHQINELHVIYETLTYQDCDNRA
jgi:hypothetical protein